MNSSKTSTLLMAAITSLAVVSAVPSAVAANITKASTGTDLTAGASWSGGVAPASGDLAIWDAGSLGAGLTLNSGTPSWQGIKINAGAADALNIGSGGTLTLGIGGIDMSAAAVDATIGSGLTLDAGSQHWNVASSGRTLTVSGTFARTAGSTLSASTNASGGVGTITFSPTLLNGILPWAFMTNSGASANNSAAGFTFATVAGGNLVAYTNAIPLTGTGAWGGIPSGDNSTVNYVISSSGTLGATGLGRNVNSIRYTGSGATQPCNINPAGNVLTINSFMNAGTGEFLIGGSGGSANNYFLNVTVGASQELVLAAMSAGITMRGGILEGAGVSALTVVGSKTVTLTLPSTYTGGTTVNGNLTLGGTATLGAAGTTLRINNGTLDLGGTTQTVGAMTFNGGKLSFPTASGSAQISADSFSVSGNPSLIKVVSPPAVLGTYPLILVTNPISGAGSLVLDTLPSNIQGTLVTNGSGPYTIALAVTNVIYSVWDGGGTDDNWTSAANWQGDVAPSLSGSAVRFAGSVRPTPNVDTNYSLAGLAFSNTVDFTIGTTNGSTLSVSGSLINNSAQANTLSLPITPFTGNTIVSAGTLAIGGTARWGGGTYGGAIGISNGAAFNYNSSTNQTLTGLISGSGTLRQTGSGTLTVLSRNTAFTGDVNLSGGVLFANPGNAANNGAFSFVSGITVNSGGTLSASFNGLFGWDGSQAKPITVLSNGVALQNGGDVNVGLITLAGGTLASTNEDTYWGSWSFGRGTDKNLHVTENSTVTANYVGFHNGATIEVDGGKTLNFQGFIPTTGADGGNAIIKTGTGTLILSGANTYAQGTTISAGTLQVGAGGTTGSIVGNVTDDASLVFNRSDSLSFDGNISGAGSLTKQGAGTLTLTGGHSIIGPLAVQAGTLSVNTALGASSGNLTVGDGAALTLSLNNGGSSANVGDATFVGNNALNLSYGTLAGTPTYAVFASGNLTKGTTTTINVSGIGFTTGMVVPLIYFTTGTATTNGFARGTLPTGVQAVLTNSTFNTLDLLITSAGNPLTWLGHDGDGTTPRPNWDVGTSVNWQNTSTFGNVPYAPGDNANFGDAGSFVTNITLNVAVSPSTMVVDTTYLPYSITGSGSIGGGFALLKTNAGSLFLGTSNSYTGGTIIADDGFGNAGSLIITNDSALGNTNGSITLAGGALRFDAGVTSARTISVTTNSTISTAANTSSALSGNVSGSSTGSLNKAGEGTLNVSGSIAVAEYNVESGTNNITGSLTTGPAAGLGRLRVGRNASTGVLNVQTGATVTVNWSVPIGSDTSAGTVNVNGGTLVHQGGLNFYVGSGSSSTGSLNLVSGSISNLAGGVYLGESGTSMGSYSQAPGTTAVLGDVRVGNSGSTGVFNQSGGTANMGVLYVPASGGTVGTGSYTQSGGTNSTTNIRFGQNNGVGTVLLSGGSLSCSGTTRIGEGTISTPAVGIMTITNATFNSEGDMFIGYSGNTGATGQVNVLNGGVLNVASTVTRWLFIRRYDTCNGELNINGGTVNLNAGTDIRYSEGNGTGRGLINLNAGALTGDSGSDLDLNRSINSADVTNIFNLNGGTLTIGSILSGVKNGSRVFNFNGGTLKPAGSSTSFFAANSASAATVQAGGAVIDTAGFNIHIGQVLDGAGGLTKKGLGALYLNGANTYTGPTTVSNGTLGGTGVILGPVVTTSAATLAPGASIGTLTISNNLTIGGGLLVEVNNTNAQTSDLCVVTGGLSNTGAGTVIVTNLGPALAVGNTFQLFSKAVVGGGSLNIVGPAGVTWTNELATLGQIRVLSVSSAPTPTLLTNSYNSGTSELSLSWPAGQGWRLQSQTTNLSVGLNTNWVYITDSSASSTNITVDKTKGTVFYRLVYP